VATPLHSRYLRLAFSPVKYSAGLMKIRQFVARSVGGFIQAHRRRLANLSIASTANGVVLFASLVALAFNTRGLGASQFGVFTVIQGYVALWAAICTLESWQAVCRLGTEEGADVRKICRRTLTLDVAAAVAGFALAASGILLFGSAIGLSAEHKVLALIYALTLLAGLAGTPKGYFRLIDRFDVLAMNQVFNALLTVAASLALWYLEADLPAYIYTFLAIGVVYRLQLVIQLLSKLKRTPPVSVAPVAQDLSFKRLAGMTFSISLLSAVIINRKNMALLTVSGIAGSAAAGIFAAAMKGAAPLTKAADLTNQVIFSDVVRALRAPVVNPGKVRRLRRLSFAMLALLMAAAGFGALLAKPLVEVLFDASFLGAAPVLAVLLFVEALHVAALIFNPAFQARGATHVLTSIYAMSVCVFVVLAVAAGSGLTPTLAALVLFGSMALAYLAQSILLLGPRGLLTRAIRP
jgi:O-antigen/teichoic acid export membrane protein